MRRLLFILCILSVLSVRSQAADAPSASQIEQRLEVVTLKLQRIASDYRSAELWVRNLQLEEAPLRAEAEHLKATLETLKPTPKPGAKTAQ